MQALYHWDFDADKQFGEVDYSTGALQLSYWVDYWLARMFPSPPGAELVSYTTTDTADIEILVPEWGDQFATEGTRLRGITYDSKEKAIEFYVEGGDHRVLHPKEVWTEEEPDGFIKAIEIVPSSSRLP